MAKPSACPGCGYQPSEAAPPDDSAIQDTAARSAFCYSCFTQLLARSYGDPAYRSVHQLLVDSYGAQHPGGNDHRSVLGTALSLMTLCLFLEHGVDPSHGPRLHNAMASKSVFHYLDPPAWRGTITAAQVLTARDAEEHLGLVRAWAEQVWQAWSPRHATVRGWLAAGGYW